MQKEYDVIYKYVDDSHMKITWQKNASPALVLSPARSFARLLSATLAKRVLKLEINNYMAWIFLFFSVPRSSSILFVLRNLSAIFAWILAQFSSRYGKIRVNRKRWEFFLVSSSILHCSSLKYYHYFAQFLFAIIFHWTQNENCKRF